MNRATWPAGEPPTGRHRRPVGGIVGRSIAAVLFGALALVARGAQGAGGAASPEAFADRFVAAINSKDAEQLRALIDRRSLACLTAEAPDLLSFSVSNWLSHSISPGYKTTIEDIGPDATLLMDVFMPGRFAYPARPTRKVQIQSEITESKFELEDAEIGVDADGWKIILGCPKPGTAAWMKQAREEGQAKHAERAKAADAVVAGMSPEHRAELAAMAKDGRIIDAYHKVQNDSQVDLTTAVLVMKIVAPSE
jgi:hypothetical protein